MLFKLFGLILAVSVINGNVSAFNYVYEKSGMKHKCGVVTDNNDNEILFANTESGPVLIPFSELIKLEVLSKQENGFNLKVIYKDNSSETVTVDNSLSLMCKQGVGRVSLNDVSYVSFVEENVEVNKPKIVETLVDSNNDAQLATDAITPKEEVLDTVVKAIEVPIEEDVKVIDSVINEEVASAPVEPDAIVEQTIAKEDVVAESPVVEENVEAVAPEIVKENEVESPAPIIENNEPVVKSAVSNNKYEVKRYDTLWDLAFRFYKNPYLWKNIYEKNMTIDDPDLIYPGDILVIDGANLGKSYSDKSSLTYNEDVAGSNIGLSKRVVVFDNNSGSLFSLRNVNMFQKELVKQDKKDTVVADQDELMKLIEEDQYTRFFSYEYFSKLGEIVPKEYEGEGYVYSRNKKDNAFIKYHSTVRINLGNKNSVKINDKYVIFDLMDDLGEEGALCQS